MPRIARVVWPGCPFHVTHRGNRRASVFLRAGDERRYLGLLRTSAERCGLRIWAYALMTNHVHLIVVPDGADAMARAIGSAHRRYSSLVNRREGWTGHLWANRFYSTPLDETHLWAAARYVELNPVRAGLVRRAEEYRWSSARAHSISVVDPVLDQTRPFPGSIPDWSTWLSEGTQDPAFDRIRRNTSTGRPSGSDEFVRRCEEYLARRLHTESPGPRPGTVRRPVRS